MQDYRVELDAFSGPLDLLLFLVKRDEVDLRDIPVARLAEQYLAYLKKLEAIDVNLAGEFLVMAATLLELKSQMLVPQATSTEGDGENGATNLAELDPRRELVAALLAYKRFKDSARMLEQRAELWSQRYPRHPAGSKAAIPVPQDNGGRILWDAVGGENLAAQGDPDPSPGAVPREFDLEDANVLDLAETFAQVMESIGRSPVHHEVLYDDTPLGLHAEDILDRLGRESVLTLQNVFEGRSRSERIGLFLALLELVRQRRVLVQQEDLNRPIQLSLRPAEDQTTALETGTTESAKESATAADYDWPDEDSRLIAQRREKWRFKWAEKKKAPDDPAESAAENSPEAQADEIDPSDKNPQ